MHTIGIGIISGLGAYLAYAVARCTFRIGEGHVGVLTSFGAAERVGGDRLRLYRPGLHFKWPWQVVHCVPLMEQIIELSGNERGRTVMMADGTLLHVDSILRFMPLESELERFLFDLKDQRKHIADLFSCLLRKELANVKPQPGCHDNHKLHGPGGSLALVRRERRHVNAEIKDFCQKEIGDVYGVHFSAVDLVDVRPPDELDEALNGVMSARSEVEEMLARAEAACERRIIAAQRGVEVAKLKASAVEREIAGLAEAVAELDRQGTLELYINRRRAEVLSQSKLHYVRVGASAAVSSQTHAAA
ncbi:SPFH domain-containing protein [Methylogaea oryzae]|uniref:Band 7 domain-containing protein n=1 Tax=Methylogaea oryzae TaxID=1295382 RepID=A0A8D4VQV3_9GAMM|nr:SPFH domain-containing protein [Methylogaea oryzae]BBL72863.1 hypothetical protein MoryE10_34690 [Methylogaea oryzae]